MIQTSPAVTRGESTASSTSPPRRGSTVPSPSVVTLTPGLSAEEMLLRLARASRATDIGNRTLAFYLHEVHVRRECQSLGYATAVHLATERLRIPRTTARELIATGGELRVLKMIDAALCQGEITWSTAKMLCRVSVPETEEEWLAKGKSLSCRKLEREIAGVEKGQRPRANRRGLPAQVFDVHTRINNVQHEMFETARRRLADMIEDHVDNRFLVMTLVEAFLRGGLRLGGDEGEAESRKGSPRSRGLLYHLIVQQCPECRETLLHTGDGPVELPQARGDAIACEAVIHRVDDAWIARGQRNGTRLSSSERHHPAPLTGDTVDIPTPAWMRTQVLLRDGVRCVCCGGRRNLQAHHGYHRVEQRGITHPINLATLCSTCHEGCHNGNLRIEGDAERRWVFLDREGHPLAEPMRDPDAIRMVIDEKARAIDPAKGAGVADGVDVALRMGAAPVVVEAGQPLLASDPRALSRERSRAARSNQGGVVSLGLTSGARASGDRAWLLASGLSDCPPASPGDRGRRRPDRFAPDPSTSTLPRFEQTRRGIPRKPGP